MENEKNILKWLNNELSVKELDSFKKTKDFKDYKELIEVSSLLNYPLLDKEKALADFKTRVALKAQPKVIPLYRRTFFKIAAACVILLGCGLMFLSNSKTTYQTAYAQVKDFTLADSTFINLNADSKISFNEKEYNSNRVLDLKGEAYFNVVKKGSFKVKTNYGDISVLGTSFNVKSRDQDFNVFCFTGRVSVSINNKVFEITKGQGLKLNSNAVVSTYTNETITLPSWMNNESVFNQVPYSEVLKEFERQYNVAIVCNIADIDFTYSGAFTNTNLVAAIKSITLPINFKYEKRGNVITIYK